MQPSEDADWDDDYQPLSSQGMRPRVLETGRADLVARYLDEGGVPLAEVADRLGFSAPSAFSRWHRVRFGVDGQRGCFGIGGRRGYFGVGGWRGCFGVDGRLAFRHSFHGIPLAPSSLLHLS